MATIYQKLSEGEVVYIIDLMGDRVFQLTPNQDYCMTKYKGKDPYSVKMNTEIVLDAIHVGEMITEAAYNKF